MVIKYLNSGGGEVKRRSGGRLLSMRGEMVSYMYSRGKNVTG